MSEAYWALGRSTGLVSLALLTLAVVLGVTARSGRPAFGLPRFAVQAVHRTTALTAVAFVGIHVASLLLDPYAQLRLVDVIVPFRAGRNAFWVGLGTVALDVLLAVVITALLRARIGPRAFRTVHWASYGLWPVALLHAIGSGSDVAQPWFVIPALVSVATVGGAIAWRLNASFHDRSVVRRRAVEGGREANR
ncbi:MAG: ferric reductase-like transmembrane domain-containing protein [Pseudoclavibacter sp.]